jgi:hypothetical protein
MGRPLRQGRGPITTVWREPVAAAPAQTLRHDVSHSVMAIEEPASPEPLSDVESDQTVVGKSARVLAAWLNVSCCRYRFAPA